MEFRLPLLCCVGFVLSVGMHAVRIIGILPVWGFQQKMIMHPFRSEKRFRLIQGKQHMRHDAVHRDPASVQDKPCQKTFPGGHAQTDFYKAVAIRLGRASKQLRSVMKKRFLPGIFHRAHIISSGLPAGLSLLQIGAEIPPHEAFYLLMPLL